MTRQQAEAYRRGTPAARRASLIMLPAIWVVVVGAALLLVLVFHKTLHGGGAGKWLGALAAIALGAAAVFGPPSFTQHLTVFILACVVGWHLVWSVTPALHTPLMSVTNAISGIILIGGMLALFGGGSGALALGGVAILVAAINVAGGFLVTQRMLRMFRK